MPITPESFLKDIDTLVSLPDICFRVKELVNDPNTSALDIAQLVAQDPHLSAQILRIANSSYYNFPMRIDTLSRAITVIGIRDLQDLVLSSSIITAFSKTENDIFDLEKYWRHSVFTGFLARQLGAKSSTKIMHRERLFVAGLLHDIGMLAMSIKIPEMMRIIVSRAEEGKESYVETEKLVFGMTHNDIGAALLRQWNLPESLQMIVKYHHSPAQATHYKLETCIIHIASAISHYLHLSPVKSNYPVKISSTAWKITGLNKESALSVIESAKTEFENSMSAFLPARQALNFG